MVEWRMVLWQHGVLNRGISSVSQLEIDVWFGAILESLVDNG